ncbi:tetratricopeptide repeat protein [Mucilaginibacter lappiensis]|uniref:Putative Zn-dependent protease n=1 Tax=Mucilaginibacter lappiensis TaxID=354630 RepID=A0A841JR61_9SPHI|nr:tetratricopeptide repeat protein [Mucilaginibacter lappiensis]MBB6130341.1 putative Zn-dependent protease [Mucilaginibacter lappiensis]
MKQYIIVVILVLQASVLFAQQEKKYIRQGNQLYQQQNYKDAENNYRVSIGKQGKTVAGNFNLGDALYKQNKYADAGQQFSKIAAASKNKNVLAKAYHNLGNSMLQSKKLEESVTAYKKSLLNNPENEETRYNLAYAQEKLKQKQKQDKNKNNKNKDKNKDNKDNKDKDKKDQDKKNDDKNKDNKDKKDDNKDGKDKNDQNKNNGDQKPDPNNVSKEDAERMLEALNNDEKQTQDKLKNKKQKGAKMHIEKEW